jgi:outer membrane receptor protein involved in Fe transport
VLRKEGRSQPLAIELTGTVGYYRRSFRAPLAVRLENAPLGTAAIAIAHRRLAHLEAFYTYMRVFNTPHPEVVLLDENVWATDFNDPPDGNTTDTHVLTTQRVDRSYVMHRLGLGGSITPWRGLAIGADYDLRLRNFTSSEPKDVAHFDRFDKRHVAVLSVSYRVSSRWRVELGYRYTIQSTRRTPGPGMSLQRTAYEINRVFAEVTATL